MADLTAADVTVTLTAQDQEFIGLGKVMTFPSLSFGGAGKTYPAGGVPLPAKHNLGIKNVISRLHIQPPVDGYLYKYDPANHKLLIYYGDYTNVADGPFVEFVGAPAATVIPLTVIGS